MTPSNLPPGTAPYRHLSSSQVKLTAERIAARVQAAFPGSGLSKVSEELRTIAAETGDRVAGIRKPDWLLRSAIWGVVILVLAVAFYLPVSIRIKDDIGGISDFMQGLEAAINNIVFVAIAFYFLMTVEMRPKRAKALAALHELRSVAHIVDMHQLSKDPADAILGVTPMGEAMETRPLTGQELANYLDLCSEQLSIVSKLAALYAYHLNDSVVLGAVNEVQQLADGLSSKIWQKIMILDIIAIRRAEPAPVPHADDDLGPRSG